MFNFFEEIGSAVFKSVELIQNALEPEAPVIQARASADRNEAMRNEIRQMRKEVDKSAAMVEKLARRVEKRRAESFQALAKYQIMREESLATIAVKTSALKLSGINIGIFGLTSTGKSTMVNSLLGKKVANTGVGETTTKLTSYPNAEYTLWDAPGRNDDLSYSNKEYISFLKGLTRRLIVIQSTIKENLTFMRLLDKLGLGYDIIVNKFDDIDQDEQDEFQDQIQSEIESLNLKQNKELFFVSAQFPKMFPSWIQMVDYLTSDCDDYDL